MWSRHFPGMKCAHRYKSMLPCRNSHSSNILKTSSVVEVIRRFQNTYRTPEFTYKKNHTIEIHVWWFRMKWEQKFIWETVWNEKREQTKYVLYNGAVAYIASEKTIESNRRYWYVWAYKQTNSFQKHLQCRWKKNDSFDVF